MLYGSREYAQTLGSDELVLDTSSTTCQIELAEVDSSPPEVALGRAIDVKSRRTPRAVKLASGARAIATLVLVLVNMMMNPVQLMHLFRSSGIMGYPVREDT